MQARHDQNIGGTREPAERIVLHDLFVECDLDGHFALVFEAHVSLVQQLHCVTDHLRTGQFRVAKVRVRDQGDARVMAQAAGHLRCLFGDVGYLFGGQDFVHGSVSDKQGLATRHDQ